MYFILAQMANFSKHIASVLFPGNLLWEENCYLSQKSIGISVDL
jgi:hypothetical protein